MATSLFRPETTMYPHFVGKTLVAKHWHPNDEDYIWVDCVEDPKLSQYVFYLELKSWKID